jgi:hypothetical protein
MTVSIYVVGLVSTTLGYLPDGGRVAGPQGDVSPVVGAGAVLSDSLSVEVDAGMTFTSSGYAGTALVPGVVWTFHPNFYGAGRALVTVDPSASLGLLAGIGATFSLAGGLAPFVEIDGLAIVAGARNDLGVLCSVGALYTF